MLGFTSNGGFPSWTEIPWEGPKELNPNLHKSQVFPKKFKHDLKRIQHELIALQFCWPKPPSVFVCMLYKMPGCHGLTPATTRHNGSVHVDWTLKQLRWHLQNWTNTLAAQLQLGKPESTDRWNFHKSSGFTNLRPLPGLPSFWPDCQKAALERICADWNRPAPASAFNRLSQAVPFMTAMLNGRKPRPLTIAFTVAIDLHQPRLLRWKDSFNV